MATISISTKVEQLLEKTLFALNEHQGATRAQKVLDEVVLQVGALRKATRDLPIDPTSHELGAMELLQLMLVRAIERKDGNRAMNFVSRRKHVPAILQMLALTPTALRPTAIAERLGTQSSNVTALLQEAESLGLISTETTVNDGREKPRKLTETGRVALTAAMPDWSIAPMVEVVAAPAIEKGMVRDSMYQSHAMLVNDVHVLVGGGRIRPKASLLQEYGRTLFAVNPGAIEIMERETTDQTWRVEDKPGEYSLPFPLFEGLINER